MLGPAFEQNLAQIQTIFGETAARSLLSRGCYKRQCFMPRLLRQHF